MRFVLPAAFLTMLLACQRNAPPLVPISYPTRDHLEVERLRSTTPMPHVIDVQRGNKRLVFIGCDHTKDTAHPQFARISALFADLRPEIAFNEGEQLRPGLHYENVTEAARTDGEAGVNKYWCDKAAIQLRSGNMRDSAEFAAMLRKYPREDLLLHYMMLRFVLPKSMGAFGSGTYAEQYPAFIGRILPEGWFHLAPKERTFAHFQELYARHMGHPFGDGVIELDLEQFDPANDSCRFCAMGRSSAMLQDSTLLRTLETAFAHYDRVLVTFGGGHALALEPALPQLMDRVSGVKVP